MGTLVPQVVLNVGLPSVDKLGRRFCADIWQISTWPSLTHFLIRWSTTFVAACFWRILWPRVGRLDVLSLTVVVRLEVLLAVKMDVLNCNQDSNFSFDLSHKLFNLLLWRATIGQFSVLLRFFCCFYWIPNQNKICSARWTSSALRGLFSLVPILKQ